MLLSPRKYIGIPWKCESYNIKSATKEHFIDTIHGANELASLSSTLECK